MEATGPDLPQPEHRKANSRIPCVPRTCLEMSMGLGWVLQQRGQVNGPGKEMGGSEFILHRKRDLRGSPLGGAGVVLQPIWRGPAHPFEGTLNRQKRDSNNQRSSSSLVTSRRQPENGVREYSARNHARFYFDRGPAPYYECINECLSNPWLSAQLRGGGEEKSRALLRIETQMSRREKVRATPQ
ncbi:hypothetical protein M514_28080 [Trichuris suis]|uniref:Uncharacterized protein n=1 Tax=Trichuris suis TaxID=68888 RepID=A0A085MR99_9BILA|nr:hypothetical protein M514_28080 [Trichuris suis]